MPYFEIEVVDYSTIGEMLLKTIEAANNFFQEFDLPHRFISSLENIKDDMFDIYLAKKNNGKPKDDYPRKY